MQTYRNGEQLFRVDPTRQVTSLIAPLVGKTTTADHGYLELTHKGPVWLLQVRRVDGVWTDGTWHQYLFEDLHVALHVLSNGCWCERDLFALLPEDISPTRKSIFTEVLEIWRYRIPGRELDYLRIKTTESPAILDVEHVTLPKVQNSRLVWSRHPPKRATK